MLINNAHGHNSKTQIKLIDIKITMPIKL